MEACTQGVNLWNLRAMGDDGYGADADIGQAIDFAIAHANEIDILSLSLGAEGHVPYLEEKVVDAWNAGIIVVCAAGNDGDLTFPYFTISSPSSALEPISVGAMYDDEYMVTYSSVGPAPDTWICKPEVVAPGTNLLSISPNNLAAAGLNGTSFSTPIVAAGIAIILSALPEKPSPNLVKAALVESCTPLGYDFYVEGAGVPNFYKMWQYLMNDEYDGVSVLPSYMVFPNLFDAEKETIYTSYRDYYPELYIPYLKASVFVGKAISNEIEITVSDTVDDFIEIIQEDTMDAEGQYIFGIDFQENMFLWRFAGTYEGEIYLSIDGIILSTIVVQVTLTWQTLWRTTIGWIMMIILTSGILGIIASRRYNKIAKQGAFEIGCPEGWECECDKETNICTKIQKIQQT